MGRNSDLGKGKGKTKERRRKLFLDGEPFHRGALSKG